MLIEINGVELILDVSHKKFNNDYFGKNAYQEL